MAYVLKKYSVSSTIQHLEASECWQCLPNVSENSEKKTLPPFSNVYLM